MINDGSLIAAAARDWWMTVWTGGREHGICTPEGYKAVLECRCMQRYGHGCGKFRFDNGGQASGPVNAGDQSRWIGKCKAEQEGISDSVLCGL
jgi:hypothetical protein